MPNPDFYESASDALVELYAQAERDILADMARRLSQYDYWIPAAEHQRTVLREMGLTNEYIMKSLSELTDKTEEELQALFKEAANSVVASDGEYYRAAGLTIDAAESAALSKNMKKILAAGMKQTNGIFKNLTRTTAQESTGAFVQALDRAWMQVSSGAFDYNTAVRTAVKDLSAKGIQTINYNSGARTSIEAAVRRAVVTGLNQTCGKMQEALADAMGCDLMEITAHAGARPSHAAWQGQIVSRSGKRGYLSLDDIGYGTGAGFKGWNCRHDWNPYVEGAPRTWTAEQLSKLEEKTIEYNGQMMTEYEASQKQRYIERQIRRWKRENTAMQAAGLDTTESAVKLKKWQAAQRDFVKKTGLKRQYDRERVAGFDLSAARRADKNAEKYYQYWSKSIGSNEKVKTLADYYDMKYNRPEEYRLLQGYSKALEKGDVSPLVGFEVYQKRAKEVQEKLIGQTTSNGITIEGFTTHFIDRVIGQTSDDHKEKRRGVTIENALNTLKFPTQIGPPRTRSDGKISVKFVGKTCEVTINPENGNLIQANPRKGK